MLSQKFLVFTENYLEIPSEKWTLNGVGVQLGNAFCKGCSSVTSVICSLYENLCDIQAKFAERMGQLSSLLEGSKERSTRRRSGKALMETLERQLGVSGNDGKKVVKMRELLSDKCKLYSMKTLPQNSQTFNSSEEFNDGDNFEAVDKDSLEVKIEASSINGSDDDDYDLQNDSKDSLNGEPNEMDDQDQDHSATICSPSHSDDVDGSSFDEDDKGKSTEQKKISTEKGPFHCESCKKEFSCKSSIRAHMRNIHGTNLPKPEKPFSCKFCPKNYGTRLSLLSHISFYHRGQSILNRSFKCDICGRGFTTQNGVVLHKRKMHINDTSTKVEEQDATPRSYNCRKCSMTFDTQRQKTNHTCTVDKKDKHNDGFINLLECTMKTDTSYSNEYLQNDFLSDSKKMDVKDQDYFTSSDDDDDSDAQDDTNDDPDFSLEKETPNKSQDKRDFIPTYKKSIHSTNLPKPEQLLSCKFCPNKYESRVSLHSHISYKHPGQSVLNRPFKCDICGRGSTTQNGVVLHKRKIHSIGLTSTEPTYAPKTFPCNLCPRSFRDRVSWKRHLKAKHQSSSAGIFFPCKQCTRNFDTYQQRVNHTKTAHEKNEAKTQISSYYSCTECSMSFDSQRQRIHHLYTVHKKDRKSGGFMKRVEGAMKADTSDQTEQSCVVCSQEFKSWKLLHLHLKQKHEKTATNKKSRMCYFCNSLFCYEQSVWAHLKTCITHNFTAIEFPCDHADHLGYQQWVFKDPTELESHFKEDHKDCEVIKCNDCAWPFLDKNMVEFHRLTHLPRIKSKFHCPGCSNTFLTTDTLQHHYNSIHGVGLKLYRCQKCKMGFSSKVAMPLHLSRCLGDNENDKQQTLEFLCSECPKSYGTAYQLKNHLRMIHTTAQCPDCGVVLPKSRIGNHKIMKHGTEKFLCTLCGKAYKKRTQLQMHMSSHGQYQWICKYCGSGSRSSGHLKRHIGRMHKDKLAEEAAAKQNIIN